MHNASPLDLDVVSRCGDGRIDPGTEKTCGRSDNGAAVESYGYDKVVSVLSHCEMQTLTPSKWTVFTNTNGNNKYIVVQVDEASSYTGANKSRAVWPPPAVNVTVNQRVRIKLINQLGDNQNRNEKVTLHFHGILQSGGYNTMDGPQGITQR